MKEHRPHCFTNVDIVDGLQGRVWQVRDKEAETGTTRLPEGGQWLTIE